MDRNTRRPPQRQQTRQAPRVASRPAPRPAQEEPLVIDEATARAIREAEGYEMQAISGYDPVAQATSATQGTAYTPAGQQSGVVQLARQGVVARRMPTPPAPQDEDEDEYDDGYDPEYDDVDLEDDEDAGEDLGDTVDDVMEYDDTAFYADASDDANAVEEANSLFDDIPPPPPTAMPIQYSGWLDLGDQDDPKYAIPYRGWKIKTRLDVSMGMLSAVEQLQDAKQRADEWKRRTGRTINTVRVEHIRTILEDIVVAWNYVDEFSHPLPQPPAGLRFLRPDLLAATLNRAMMEFSPSKKSKKRSTRR